MKNHGITEWLKPMEPLNIIGPSPLLKRGHLETIAQDHVRMAFEDLQEGRPYNLSGQHLPVLGHPHSEKVLLDVQIQLLVFNLCPLLLFLSLNKTEKNLAPVSLHPAFRYTLVRSALNLLFSRLNSTSCRIYT